MLKSIFKILKSIGEGIRGVLKAIYEFFEEIEYVNELVGEFITDIPDLFSWLPSTVVVVIVAIFGIVIIYKVFGREG